MEDVHQFAHNNANGTWCQEHTEILLVNSRTFLYTTLQQDHFFYYIYWTFYTSVTIWTSQTRKTAMTDFDNLNDPYAKLTTESFIWCWLKICWKWVQESLILIPPQEEDCTHKLVKWHNWKDDSLNIGQFQGHICSVAFAQPNIDLQLPILSAKNINLCCA